MLHTRLTILFMTLLAGCTSVVGEPTPTAAPDTPAEVIAARDAVLEFMHEGAILCVPPEGVTWRLVEDGNDAPDGFEVYAFRAEECTLLVTYYPGESEDTTYHVSLNNQASGCCWQARVDSTGHIILTGNAAATEPGNPAAAFCEREGYDYQIVTREDGTQCCACVFPDGSTCNGWDFFWGECQPGDNPETNASDS